jgi:hypothetical protein
MIVCRRILAWTSVAFGIFLLVGAVMSPGRIATAVCLAGGLFMLVGGVVVDFHLANKLKPPPRPRR